MMKLVMNGQEHEFNFGIGFLRTLDQKYFIVTQGMKMGVALEMIMPQLLAYDAVTLSDVLVAAGNLPVTTVDNYIDDPETDIEALFNEVIDELKKSSCTRLKVGKILEDMEEKIQE